MIKAEKRKALLALGQNQPAPTGAPGPLTISEIRAFAIPPYILLRVQTQSGIVGYGECKRIADLKAISQAIVGRPASAYETLRPLVPQDAQGAIDMALLDCAVASQVNLAQAFLSSGETPPRQGNAHLQIVPYQLFATADSWLVLAVGNDGQWRRFCAAVDRPVWADDVRFVDNPSRVRHREALTPLIEAIMRTKKTAEWQQMLAAAEVPHAPVWTYADVFGCPQAAARGLRVEVRDPSGRLVNLIGTPFHIAGATLPVPTVPPTLGQHTDEVLTKLLAMDAERLVELRRQGII